MPDNPIILTQTDLKPLLQNAAAIDGAVDSMERALLAYHQGAARQSSSASDQIEVNGQPSVLRADLLAANGMASGLRIAGSATLPNGRVFALFDGETRQLLALMDNGPFGALRVGAEGGLAARHLAPSGARSLGLIGSGRQARTQIQAVVRSMPNLQRAVVFSPTTEHRESFAKEMSTWLEFPIEPVATIEEATRGHDVVDLCATPREPLIELSWMKPGSLLISVTGRGQLPYDFVTGTRLVSPTWETVAENPLRDPYTAAIKSGAFTKNDYAGELGSAIAGAVKPRRTPQDVVTFELTSVPILDLAVAEWAYQWARANRVGTEFNLSA